MKVFRSQNKNTKKILISEYIDFDMLKDITRQIIKEEDIFFILTNEDTTFESKEDDEKYRKFLPDYFRENGTYKCIYDENLNKEKINRDFDTRFKYVASLKNNEETIKLLPIIFEYYGDVVMIGSNKSEDLESIIRHCKESGEKLIEIGITNITLVHTDYSVFIINIEKDARESIEEEVQNIIGKYCISQGGNNEKREMRLKYKIAIIMTFTSTIILMFCGLYYGWIK